MVGMKIVRREKRKKKRRVVAVKLKSHLCHYIDIEDAETVQTIIEQPRTCCAQYMR
jgi:hypothetical protein